MIRVKKEQEGVDKGVRSTDQSEKRARRCRSKREVDMIRVKKEQEGADQDVRST